VRSGARPTSHSDIRLLRLLKQESGQSAKDLAERMEIRPPSLSEALDRLEKRGMIQRQRDERDSRVVRISLTEQGAEALEQNGDENKYLQQQIDSCLTAEEKQTFCEICEKLSSHLTQLTEPKKEEGI
jgi:DNA-binding MarR family transcriptional regulator